MKFRKLSGAILILILLIFTFTRPSDFLQIVERNSGEILFLIPVSTGDRFIFEYVHSVENTPVTGIFSVLPDGKLAVLETAFSSYGTGLPLFEPQEQIVRQNGMMTVKHTNQFLEKFPLVVMGLAKQRVKLKGMEIRLSDFVKDGAIVDIQVIKKPLYYKMIRMRH